MPSPIQECVKKLRLDSACQSFSLNVLNDVWKPFQLLSVSSVSFSWELFPVRERDGQREFHFLGND